MNNLTAVTMSSREIAELTGKEHNHVRRDIKVMLKELGKDESNFGHIYKDSMNRSQTEFLLPRLEVECLLTGYSVPLRMKCLERLKELEEQVKKPVVQLPNFNDPIAAARAWADAKESEQLALIQLKEKEEEIDELNNLFKEGMSPRDYCKGLNGVNINQVNNILFDKEWVFKSNGGWRVYAGVRDKYLTEQVITTLVDGEYMQSYKPILLKEGAKELFKFYVNNELPMKKTWDGKFTLDKF